MLICQGFEEWLPTIVEMFVTKISVGRVQGIVCLFDLLFIERFVFLSVCLYIYLVYPSIYFVWLCLSIFLYAFLSVWWFFSRLMAVFLFICILYSCVLHFIVSVPLSVNTSISLSFLSPVSVLSIYLYSPISANLNVQSVVGVQA